MKARFVKTGIFASAALAALCMFPAVSAAACVVSVTGSGGEIILPPEVTEATDQQPGADSPASGTPHMRSIVGLWKVVFYHKGQITDVAFESWERGGTEILNDYSNPIEDNVCLGVWVQTAPGTVKLKHLSWTYDSSGNLTGSNILRETVTLDADADTFTGPYTLDVYDTSGHLLFHFEGNVKATLIRPD